MKIRSTDLSGECCYDLKHSPTKLLSKGPARRGLKGWCKWLLMRSECEALRRRIAWMTRGMSMTMMRLYLGDATTIPPLKLSFTKNTNSRKLKFFPFKTAATCQVGVKLTLFCYLLWLWGTPLLSEMLTGLTVNKHPFAPVLYCIVYFALSYYILDPDCWPWALIYSQL